MLTLYELQEKFVNAINSTDDSIFSYIKEDANLSSKQHLGIYQSSIVGALQKTLKDIYIVCHKLVGEDFFIGMINRYIENNPSVSPDIANYGASFPAFVAAFEPAKSLPYLPDITKLEWAWHDLYRGRDAEGIDFEKLSRCYEACGDKIIFSLPPNSTLVFSHYPIHRIWEVNQDSFQGDSTIILEDTKKYYFLVWRKKLEMRIDLLNETEWLLLTLIQEKLNLGELYAKIHETSLDINFEAILPHLVNQGWLAECEIG